MTETLTLTSRGRDTLAVLANTLARTVLEYEWQTASLILTSEPEQAGLSRAVSVTGFDGETQVIDDDTELHLPSVQARLAMQLADGTMFETLTVVLSLDSPDAEGINVNVTANFRGRDVKIALG